MYSLSKTPSIEGETRTAKNIKQANIEDEFILWDNWFILPTNQCHEKGESYINRDLGT